MDRSATTMNDAEAQKSRVRSPSPYSDRRRRICRVTRIATEMARKTIASHTTARCPDITPAIAKVRPASPIACFVTCAEGSFTAEGRSTLEKTRDGLLKVGRGTGGRVDSRAQRDAVGEGQPVQIVEQPLGQGERRRAPRGHA